MATILAIKEGDFVHDDKTFAGFTIVLSDGELLTLGIRNDSICCERWGYFMTNDKPDDFIGAELREVKVVDESLNVATLEKALQREVVNETNTMFVNIETDRGTLQFTAYNEHNGYYSHEATVRRGSAAIASARI